MFPIMLCATRLSGIGSDMLFIGLLRRLPLPALMAGRWLASGPMALVQSFAVTAALPTASAWKQQSWWGSLLATCAQTWRV